MVKESLVFQWFCATEFKISMPHCRETRIREWKNNMVHDYHTFINLRVIMPWYFCTKRSIYLEHIKCLTLGDRRSCIKIFTIGISKGNFKKESAPNFARKHCFSSAVSIINECYFKGTYSNFEK